MVLAQTMQIGLMAHFSIHAQLTRMTVLASGNKFCKHIVRAYTRYPTLWVLLAPVDNQCTEPLTYAACSHGTICLQGTILK